MSRSVYLSKITHQLCLDDGTSIDNVYIQDVHVDFPEMYSGGVYLRTPEAVISMNILINGEPYLENVYSALPAIPEIPKKVKRKKINV